MPIFCLLLSLLVRFPVSTVVMSDQAVVEDMVRALGDAYRDVDLNTLDALTAPDYVHTNGGGTVIGKSAWMEWNRKRRAWLDGGHLAVERYETHDLEVRLFGETAIATGRVVSSGVRNGERFDVDVRFTQVWLRRDGVWLRVAFQDAPTKE